jgi:hypothetical protein
MEQNHSGSEEITHFYGTRIFITVFTGARHWSLSQARWITSISSHPTSLKSILILSSHLHLGLPSNFFPSMISDQNVARVSPVTAIATEKGVYRPPLFAVFRKLMREWANCEKKSTGSLSCDLKVTTHLHLVHRFNSACSKYVYRHK